MDFQKLHLLRIVHLKTVNRGKRLLSLTPTAMDTTNNIMPEVAPVSYQEPVFWADIAYYELNCRVGEVFHCQTNGHNHRRLYKSMY
ncbi:hypothetical protein L9F63_026551 [Diploptera punctata]|uniref:MH2 domain-containing protein n=1 Tax=Diploptera punctata TaxID=6984 RepID=A0AAD8AJM9_DIPPU|nr:hypothetical protein L9F63_026551 [Diploptera punctata]